MPSVILAEADADLRALVHIEPAPAPEPEPAPAPAPEPAPEPAASRTVDQRHGQPHRAAPAAARAGASSGAAPPPPRRAAAAAGPGRAPVRMGKRRLGAYRVGRRRAARGVGRAPARRRRGRAARARRDDAAGPAPPVRRHAGGAWRPVRGDVAGDGRAGVRPVDRALPRLSRAGAADRRRRARRREGARPDLDALREMVHEIKTPLNAIIGFAEIIDGQYLGPAHRRYRERAASIVEPGAASCSTRWRISTSPPSCAPTPAGASARRGRRRRAWSELFPPIAAEIEQCLAVNGGVLELDIDQERHRCALSPDLATRLLRRLLLSLCKIVGERRGVSNRGDAARRDVPADRSPARTGSTASARRNWSIRRSTRRAATARAERRARLRAAAGARAGAGRRGEPGDRRASHHARTARARRLTRWRLRARWRGYRARAVGPVAQLVRAGRS